MDITKYEKAHELIEYLNKINKQINLLKMVKDDLFDEYNISKQHISYYRKRDTEWFTKKDLAYLKANPPKYNLFIKEK